MFTFEGKKIRITEVISNDELTEVYSLFAQENITAFEIINATITSGTLYALITALPATLEILHIEGQAFSIDIMTAVNTKLAQGNITDLSLIDCGIDDEILYCLISCYKLDKLNLSNNIFTDKGIKILSSTILYSTNLTTLIFENVENQAIISQDENTHPVVSNKITYEAVQFVYNLLNQVPRKWLKVILPKVGPTNSISGTLPFSQESQESQESQDGDKLEYDSMQYANLLEHREAPLENTRYKTLLFLAGTQLIPRLAKPSNHTHLLCQDLWRLFDSTLYTGSRTIKSKNTIG